MMIFVCSWVFLVAFEPGNTWGKTIEHKLIDCASGVAATLNNIGPGLGIVGATQQYTAFQPGKQDAVYLADDARAAGALFDPRTFLAAFLACNLGWSGWADVNLCNERASS